MPFDPLNDLERSLMKAATEPAHRPQFYRDFLAADVFVIQHGPPQNPDGVHYAKAGDSLQLPTWEKDGQPLIPIFSSLPRLQAFVTEEVSYVGMNARAFLEMTRGTNLILNPGADYGKEFPPEEVAAMLDGSIFKPYEQIVTAKDTQVLIGQPARYPDALVETLREYFQKTKQVKRAYLAHYHNPESGTPPHTLIGVEATGDWEQVAAGASQVMRNVAIPDPPVDFMQMTGSVGVEEHLRTSVKPFYEKKKFLGIF